MPSNSKRTMGPCRGASRRRQGPATVSHFFLPALPPPTGLTKPGNQATRRCRRSLPGSEVYHSGKVHGRGPLEMPPAAALESADLSVHIQTRVIYVFIVSASADPCLPAGLVNYSMVVRHQISFVPDLTCCLPVFTAQPCSYSHASKIRPKRQILFVKFPLFFTRKWQVRLSRVISCPSIRYEALHVCVLCQSPAWFPC